MTGGPYRRLTGPTGNWRGLQMTGEDCRYDSGVADPSRTIGPYSHPLRW